MYTLLIALLELTILIGICGVIVKAVDIRSPSPVFVEKEIINRRAVVAFIAICVTSGVFGYIECTPGSHYVAKVCIGAYVLGAAIPQIVARLVLYRLGVQSLIQCVAGIVGGHMLGRLLLQAFG